jgi:hypothetical protein
MEMFIGVVVGFFIQSIIKAGWRLLNRPLAPVPQPPKTSAQQANQEVFEDVQAHTPRVLSVPVRRRPGRGRTRPSMEREEEFFDE